MSRVLRFVLDTSPVLIGVGLLTAVAMLAVVGIDRRWPRGRSGSAGDR